mgnify:CR=1 FL=1
MTTSLEWPQTSSNFPSMYLISRTIYPWSIPLGDIPDLGRPLGYVLSIHSKGWSLRSTSKSPGTEGMWSSSLSKLGLDEFTSCAFIVPTTCIEGSIQLSTEGLIQAATLHDVVPSTSQATRRRVTLSHTLLAWGKSLKECLRVSIGEEQSGQSSNQYYK